MSASPAAAVAAKKAPSVFQRVVVAPFMNTAHKIEHSSTKKLGAVEPAISSLIDQSEKKGVDAATVSRQRFLHEQKQLLHYRVVRFFEETRYIASGQYFKHYNVGCLLQDARFLTQALFLFLIGVLVGRRSIFPPIAPESPLAIALQHKVNPN